MSESDVGARTAENKHTQELVEAARAVLENYGYFHPGMTWGLPDHHPLTALWDAVTKAAESSGAL